MVDIFIHKRWIHRYITMVKGNNSLDPNELVEAVNSWQCRSQVFLWLHIQPALIDDIAGE